jgi:hypothetical protein
VSIEKWKDPVYDGWTGEYVARGLDVASIGSVIFNISGETREPAQH